MLVQITGGVMKVDREDWLRFCLEVGASLSVNGSGYAVYSYRGKKYLFHRWVMGFPPGKFVGHLKCRSTR